MSEPHLLIAMPCRDQIRATAFPALVGAMIRARKFWNETVGSSKFGYVILPGVQAAEARTRIWEHACQHGMDWVLWLDDDMSPPIDILEMLWKGTPMGDIVTGFYWRKGDGCSSTVCRFPSNGGPAEWLDSWDMKLPYEEVHGCGFGAVLMKRKVIDHVALENNGLPFLTKPGCTEDIYFCNAARRLNYKVIAAREAECGHVGDHIYTAADRRAVLAADDALKAEGKSNGTMS